MVSDTCFDISRHESNLTPKFLTVTAGTSPLPRISAGKKGIRRHLMKSRASLLGNLDDSESGGARFGSRSSEKNLLVLFDKALYLRLSWIMTTFRPAIMGFAMAP